MHPFLFPRWTNKLRTWLGLAAVGGPVYLVLVTGLGASARTLNVGYSPRQPVEFSHRMHAGELGMDCRYCHTTVDKAAHAAVPSTAICMNCHKFLKPETDKSKPIKESATTGQPIPWLRVHNLPDYVYFDHSAHVTRGVGCVSCHGRIDTMERVFQAEPLSMGWCLECHRNPEPHLRPLDRITDMAWQPDEPQSELGRRLAKAWNIHPSTDCSTCHR